MKTKKHPLLTCLHLTMSLILCLFVLSHSVSAFTMAEAKEVQRKAAESMSLLQTALEDGKDVAEIMPMMKQVKVLGDTQKIGKANVLLDKILLKFEQLDATGDNDPAQTFGNPVKVNIIGLDFGAMEPFISRDGRYLFFNSDEHDTPETGKDIFYAERIDDFTFRYKGEVQGINTNVVDGVPSMDRDYNFYYVSVKNYNRKNEFNTVYRGKFRHGQVEDIHALPELSLRTPGWLNMDIEISADGQTLYATQTNFSNGPPPSESYFFSASLQDGIFVTNENSANIFKNINSDDLEYAASISSDGLELFFTRGSNFHSAPKFLSFRATRASINEAFEPPQAISAITGFAEAPAVSDDGKMLYYHKKDKGRFYIYALQRVGK